MRSAVRDQQLENDPIAFGVDVLKQAGAEIAPRCSSTDFINFVHTKASLKFDGEYEVLIKDLLSDHQWGSQIETPLLDSALADFQHIHGRNYYPQIYIPSLQYKEDYPDSVVQSGEVIYTFYAGDYSNVSNPNEQYAAYRYQNNQLVYYGLIDENYANTHEVWVFSVNETVNDLGLVPYEGGWGGGDGSGQGTCSDYDCDSAELKTIPYPDYGHDKVNCKMTEMAIKNAPKESWIAGASEIAIRARLSCINDRWEGQALPAPDYHYLSDETANKLGVIIRKFKRKEVKKSKVISLDFPLQTNWQYQYYRSDPVYFDYVIFERDIWPSDINNVTFYGRRDNFDYLNGYPSAPNWHIEYRSGHSNYNDWGDSYVRSDLCNNIQIITSQEEYYYTGLVNNSVIYFKTTGY